MNLFALLLLAMNIIASNASPNNTRYPQDALQCYTSSALSSQKDGAIICPQDRQAFCIKEVINSSRRECGSVEGIYYGRDVWDRKVSAVRYDWTEPWLDIIFIHTSRLQARTMRLQKMFSNMPISRRRSEKDIWRRRWIGFQSNIILLWEKSVQCGREE